MIRGRKPEVRAEGLRCADRMKETDRGDGGNERQVYGRKDWRTDGLGEGERGKDGG